jgi:hypothetical protein
MVQRDTNKGKSLKTLENEYELFVKGLLIS